MTSLCEERSLSFCPAVLFEHSSVRLDPSVSQQLIVSTFSNDSSPIGIPLPFNVSCLLTSLSSSMELLCELNDGDDGVRQLPSMELLCELNDGDDGIRQLPSMELLRELDDGDDDVKHPPKHSFPHRMNE